jgi:transcriptional regulator with XRE-family HTH domain
MPHATVSPIELGGRGEGGGLELAELGHQSWHDSGLSALRQEATRAEASSPQRFGQLLRMYRKELGLSQRVLADILGVDTSTIARVESGTRNPPRDADFYRHLHDIPGLEQAHIQALLATEDAPQLVVPPAPSQAPPPKPLPKVEIASLGDLQVTLTLGGNTAEFPEEELQRVLRSAKETTEVLLRRLSQRSAKPPRCGPSSKPSTR